MMTFNRDKAGKFRDDFQKAVKQLEKDYNCNISLGAIRFGDDELRAKMTAKIGEPKERLSAGDFKVGEIVFIDHKKVPSTETFEILKINRKNIKLRSRDNNQIFTASPIFLKRS
jgi:hypothetical protein